MASLSRSYAFSLAGLLGLAGLVGLWLGLRAQPPGEMEIITVIAAGYVVETGGSLTDCHAEPSALPEVRLVIVCQPGHGALRLYPVDDWGVLVDIADPLDGEAPRI
ncbi:hypothetical protein E2K80_01160 [Rhodophyticola sp. CCM32]|uniref:hypothetical protein n=1 Tax=Rhodophyticola sp. CCM32 TaxID=2916397 RepID=UPI00107F797A|nr:hypothetical protein [Rhodophyticola sp. CCM32]QBX99505.1 hypothetical protein E2K80_01160 [Rhodophyticola sp. CCM32]